VTRALQRTLSRVGLADGHDVRVEAAELLADLGDRPGRLLEQAAPAERKPAGTVDMSLHAE